MCYGRKQCFPNSTHSACHRRLIDRLSEELPRNSWIKHPLVLLREYCIACSFHLMVLRWPKEGAVHYESMSILGLSFWWMDLAFSSGVSRFIVLLSEHAREGFRRYHDQGHQSLGLSSFCERNMWQGGQDSAACHRRGDRAGRPCPLGSPSRIRITSCGAVPSTRAHRPEKTATSLSMAYRA